MIVNRVGIAFLCAGVASFTVTRFMHSTTDIPYGLAEYLLYFGIFAAPFGVLLITGCWVYRGISRHRNPSG
jgi:hypothetical protein